MKLTLHSLRAAATAMILVTVFFAFAVCGQHAKGKVSRKTRHVAGSKVTNRHAVAYDLSRPLRSMILADKEMDSSTGQTPAFAPHLSDPAIPTQAHAGWQNDESHEAGQQNSAAPITPPVMTSPPGAEAVEQRSQGRRPGAALVESFDGLGVGFEGPQGTASLRNPSDNSLAVGPNHIIQTVNTRM